MGQHILGVDIGGSGIKGAPVDLDKGVFADDRVRIDTPDDATPEAVADIVLRHIEHINLYSATRGSNRFPNLIRLFDALAHERALQQHGIALPDLAALRHYCETVSALGDITLAQEVARTRDPELAHILEWSRALSHDIDTRMADVPLFDGARRTLEKMAQSSDLAVISQTPAAALRREWRAHGIDSLVPDIVGQEQGSKARQLQLANSERYPPSAILMIGDALGDHAAAQACGAHFYPILPGEEVDSWRCLHEEAYPRFLSGTYAGAYAETFLQRFMARLAD